MKIRRILVTITLFFVIMSTIPAASAATVDDLSSEMLKYYYYYAGDGMADIDRLLQEMEAQDADKAAQWRTLMDAWHRAHSQINFRDDASETLPDGLPNDDSLCIVVMGYQLGAGGAIQNELAGRLEIALAAAQKYPKAYILVTGGATGSGSNTTEAAAMAGWLVNKGISSTRIIQETNANSTEKNAINSLKILKADYPQIRHLALVTSDYHIIRSYLVFAGRQAAVGGDIIDIVGHACYNTPESTSMSYRHQAELIAMMTDVEFSAGEKPTLSQLTGLTISCNPTTEQWKPLEVTATAEYDTGFTRDVTADTVFEGVDTANIGTQELTASYTGNGTTATATMSIEVVAGESEPTAAPTDPVEADAEAPAQTDDSTQVPKWLTGIAVVLVIALLILLYELWQQYSRIKRRKNRKRQRLNLE